MTEPGEAGDAATDPARRADSPRILILPPLVYLAAFGLGGALDRIWPWPLSEAQTTIETLRWPGGLLVALGVALDLWSIGLFGRAGTSAVPFRPASKLVGAGPYRWTRNPMYLGMTLTLLGVGLFLGHAWIALSALAAAVFIDRYAISREERYLERAFGASYLEYKGRVRRWI